MLGLVVCLCHCCCRSWRCLASVTFSVSQTPLRNTKDKKHLQSTGLCAVRLFSGKLGGSVYGHVLHMHCSHALYNNMQ